MLKTAKKGKILILLKACRIQINQDALQNALPEKKVHKKVNFIERFLRSTVFSQVLLYFANASIKHSLMVF